MPPRPPGYSRAVIPIVKGHGLGNDYLVVRGADLPAGTLAPAAAIRLCDRHRGVGADGVLVHVASAQADAGVRIFNPDGSEAEKSGNGLRIFAAYLWMHGHVGAPDFTVETLSGVVSCRCRVVGGRIDGVVVEMGRASFAADAVPMLGVAGEAVGVPLEVPGGERLVVTAVTVGNPHCVVFDDAPSEARCRALGPLLERHPAFPQRTNVQLARVVDPRTLAIEIWERGAGYTLASGSSSCAAAAAAVRTGRLAPGAIDVTMPGGTLVVHVRDDWSIRLDGPAVEVFTGVLAPEFAADVFRASPGSTNRASRDGRPGS
jgi:diaminopimelate epimerase